MEVEADPRGGAEGRAGGGGVGRVDDTIPDRVARCLTIKLDLHPPHPNGKVGDGDGEGDGEDRRRSVDVVMSRTTDRHRGQTQTGRSVVPPGVTVTAMAG